MKRELLMAAAALTLVCGAFDAFASEGWGPQVVGSTLRRINKYVAKHPGVQNTPQFKKLQAQARGEELSKGEKPLIGDPLYKAVKSIEINDTSASPSASFAGLRRQTPLGSSPASSVASKPANSAASGAGAGAGAGATPAPTPSAGNKGGSAARTPTHTTARRSAHTPGGAGKNGTAVSTRGSGRSSSLADSNSKIDPTKMTHAQLISAFTELYGQYISHTEGVQRAVEPYRNALGAVWQFIHRPKTWTHDHTKKVYAHLEKEVKPLITNVKK